MKGEKEPSSPERENLKIPAIKILAAMSPLEVDGEGLVSPNIDKSVEKYHEYEQLAWKKYLNAEDGSLEEIGATRTLARIHLLKTSQKLSSSDVSYRSPERDTWAQRFTEASAELYQPPQLPFVQKIVHEQFEEFSTHSGSFTAGVTESYGVLLSMMDAVEDYEGAPDETLLTLGESAVRDLSGVFIEKNADWFTYLAENGEDSYSPEELQRLFSELIELRRSTDERWDGWTAELTPDKDTVSVLATDKVVSIGENRANATLEEAIGLVAHELGVHAQRSINGKEISEKLSKGLSGYIDIEESLGIFAELLVTGKMPAKAEDRYVDIALAMGVIPGIQLSRTELIDFSLNRSLARIEISGGDITPELVKQELKKSKTHVNRIFRGGDGQDSEVPAVFTKDAIYYPAVLEDYMARQIQEGKSPEEILGYLLQGKFDPTNPSHVAYLEERDS